MNDITLYEKIPELENSFPLKIAKYHSDTISAHWHEHIEMLYIISGSGDFFCNSKNFRASAGETVIFNGNVLHSMKSEKELEYICIIINPIFFKNVNFENIILNSKIPADSVIKECFFNIFSEWENREAYFDMRIMGHAYTLAAHLAKNYTNAHLSPSEYEELISRMKKTNRITDYVHKHYGETISTSHLAKIFYLSEGYLCHIFKEATGKTLIQYINAFRAEKAAILLKKTNENVSDIAMKCGFENVTYFNRIFKKHFGITPSEFRNKKAV